MRFCMLSTFFGSHSFGGDAAFVDRLSRSLARHGHEVHVIHCRDADADMLRMLKDEFDRRGPIRGVMHSFVGNSEMAEACLAMGLALSFAGMLTYKNNDDLRRTAATRRRNALRKRASTSWSVAQMTRTFTCVASLLDGTRLPSGSISRGWTAACRRKIARNWCAGSRRNRTAGSS